MCHHPVIAATREFTLGKETKNLLLKKKARHQATLRSRALGNFESILTFLSAHQVARVAPARRVSPCSLFDAEGEPDGERLISPPLIRSLAYVSAAVDRVNLCEQRDHLSSHLSAPTHPLQVPQSMRSTGSASKRPSRSPASVRPGEGSTSSSDASRHGTAQHSTAQHSTAQHTRNTAQ